VTGSEVVATATVSTVPKLVAYAERFKANMAAQRDGASRESQAFRVTRQPKPDNPLSAVANAMLQNARTRFKEADKAISYEVVQELSLQLGTLRLNLFPRTMMDNDMAQFTGREVRAYLERTVDASGSLAQRNLRLAFSTMAISRFNNLNHQMAAQKSFPNGQEWMQAITQRAPEATIFALPAMRIKMASEEDREGQRTALDYDFYSCFVRGARGGTEEDIFISLNISLYSWLTVLRKNFAREMDDTRATKPTGASPAMPTPVLRKFPEPIRMGRSKPGAKSSRSLSRSPPRKVLLEGALGRRRDMKYANVHPSSPSLRTSDKVSSSTEASPVEPQSSPDALSPLSPAFNLSQGSSAHWGAASSPPGSPTKVTTTGEDAISVFKSPFASSDEASSSSSRGLTYRPRHRQIERLTMRQLGEATPDVMHPFFMKTAGFNLEESLPQYVHEYATAPLEEIMEALLELYGRQLRAGRSKGSSQ
jgi:hypothetical protein